MKCNGVEDRPKGNPLSEYPWNIAIIYFSWKASHCGRLDVLSVPRFSPGISDYYTGYNSSLEIAHIRSRINQWRGHAFTSLPIGVHNDLKEEFKSNVCILFKEKKKKKRRKENERIKKKKKQIMQRTNSLKKRPLDSIYQ